MFDRNFKISLIRQKPVKPWPLVVLLVIISSGAIIGGLWYYDNQKRDLIKNSLQDLSTISDLKIRQITQWRKERLSDGLFLSQNISITGNFSRYLKQPENKRIREELRNDLKILSESYDYKNALFVDSDCRVRLFYPDKDTIIGDYLKPKLIQYIRDGKVVLTDFHQTGKVSFIHLDLIVPLKLPGESNPLGLIILRIDPYKVLYPLIRSWPLASKTSESLLFHREGDEIVYLNELRHAENSQLVLRLPVILERLPAVMALQGVRETSEGVDYRGVKVIAAMNKVPESDWYMVAKTDRDEIFEALSRVSRMVLIVVTLIILTASFFIGLLWWRQRVRFYQSKYEAEVERMALVRHYDYIMKNANDIIFLFDKDYSIVEANDKALEVYKYRKEELVGQSGKILRAPEASSSIEHDLGELDKAGFSTYETIHCRKDGSTFPIEISARKLEIEGTVFYQSISRDITERKLTEETLKESEEKFRKLFEESPMGMVMTGKDMSILRANSAFCKMIGYSEDQLYGLTFRAISHPDSITHDEIGILNLVSKKVPVYRTEKQYLRQDGSVIWGSTTVVIIRSKLEEVQFFFAMVEDITSRKKAEAELEKSFSLQNATLESTADGILVVDSNGKVVRYNRKFSEMWRIPDSVMETMDDNVLLTFVREQVKDPDNFLRQVMHLYSDPEAITSDLLEFTDGRVYDRYSKPQKLSGNTTGRVWSFRDITEREKAKADLIAAKERAEESDRLKTAFLHNVSHEIRTPMNAILGFSTLLNEPGISDDERKQFTEVITQSGNQLLSIINDIVDLASIESGQIKVSIKQLNVNTTLRSISEQFSYREKSQKITLLLETPLPQLEAEILADGTKLVQILSNLINNAFKFTKKGTISFGYSIKDSFIEFFVKDTGIGISSKHHSKIFKRFYQVDNAVSRQFGGTGLGLSICKAYVELLGGKIWLKSTPGKGTEFYFTIPYVKGEFKPLSIKAQL